MVSARPVLHISKQVRELRTFETLARVIDWKIVPGSIQQPPPPQPDILCEVVGRGPVAVELVSLDDEETNLRLSNMFSRRAAWARALSRWPEARQRRLRDDLQNAYVSLNVAEELGPRDRAEILYILQQVLIERPKFSGAVSLITNDTA